eukprot:4170-Heterococcus_DN1.PRE.1
MPVYSITLHSVIAAIMHEYRVLRSVSYVLYRHYLLRHLGLYNFISAVFATMTLPIASSRALSSALSATAPLRSKAALYITIVKYERTEVTR